MLVTILALLDALTKLTPMVIGLADSAKTILGSSAVDQIDAAKKALADANDAAFVKTSAVLAQAEKSLLG